MQKQNDLTKKSYRKKYVIPVVIILCILAGYIYKVITWTPIDSESKKASEAIIRQAVTEQLNKDPNDQIDPNSLTDVDFAQIKSIIIHNQALSDITLLEKCTNLEALTLNLIQYPENNIPVWMKILDKLNIMHPHERLFIDLKPIRKLKKLRKINLSNSSIYGHNLTPRGSVSPFKNIEPLSSLMNLTDLDLSGTYVLSIEPIKNFRNLQELDISYTDIFDFEPLKELKNLQRLIITNCPDITDQQVEDLQKALPDLKIYQ